ncbi:hypothetical protein DL768_011824 [Monosporascus sp. mg162]|nr:hypothetical protein DL768_011824 [Monosporascus sp. mg162]
MNLANAGQAVSLAEWRTVFYLILAGTIITCPWLLRTLRTLAHADAAPQRRPERSARQTHSAHDPTPSFQRGAHLRQVYPTKDEPEDDGPGPDIDIIAIHGLDTNSEKTWTWRGNGRKVNWLADPDMLPSRVERVRIFTYDWPADLLQPSDLVQKTEDEFAVLLFEDIRRELQITSDSAGRKGRPILFIASCLGGIILMKALVGAGPIYQSVRRATRGIVFLATPFRGTSFQDVANLAEPGLNAWAWIRGREVIKLLATVKEPTLDLVKLVQDFTSLCQDKDNPCQVSTFYEKGKTSLPSKVFPWLPAWLRQEKLLVDESSAALDMVLQPLPLSRTHVMMNKFAHRECTEKCKKGCTESEDFGRVCGKIEEMLRKIREGSPLEQADVWIRDRYYTPDRLKIERLSGDMLPMDRCYINLAIVVEAKKSRHPEEGSEKDAASHTSPFSLAARLKVETPETSIQVELRSLFDQRKDSNGQTIQPRRILIRGRAGVGKTTLCKKMVHDFINYGTWKGLFDRVLWVPLRRLKGWPAALYNLEELFSYEYFAQHRNRIAIIEELLRVVESNNKRTLFILDGLDEISQHLDGNNQKSDFVQHLLNQSSVIITTRPHVLLPAGVHSPDLELETIGFYPHQVKEYLQATFADPKRVEDVQSYLQAHQIIQDLVRIPIQLDALCYTWDTFNGKIVPQTMTAIYKAIEESLWKKDIVRLEKRTSGQIRIARRPEISNSIKDEVHLLEILAFTGTYNDLIDFEPRHRDAMSELLNSAGTNLLFDETLGQLSFLRTSDPSSNDRDRNYHFLHLTFQEYFAARYFVRQWKAKQSLNCLQLSDGDCSNIEPATFLQEHKYDPRYDIFWRFVAGLLDADREALSFFQTIEKEPRDLLGPTHQRLVMHCLSEVERKESTFTKLRVKLENQLEQWLLFECDFTESSSLAREMECPEQVLANALKQAPEDARPILLESLSIRTAVPSSVINVASPWLSECASKRLCIAILRILRHQHKGLPDTILQGIAARLEDENGNVRQAAIAALQGRADLTEKMLQGIAARLEDEYWNVRQAAIGALQGRADLTEKMLEGIAVRLEDEDRVIRRTAIKAFQGRADLTEKMLKGIAARLEHKDGNVRRAAIEALINQAVLSLDILSPYVKPLYKALLQKSFKEHLFCISADAVIVIVIF